MDLNELKFLRESGASIKEISEKTKFSTSHIKQLLKKHKFEKINKKIHSPLFCKECNILLIGEQQLFCSLSCKNKHNAKASNLVELTKIRGHERKKELLVNFGGKCQLCGYDKCSRALTFHHRNPLEKCFQLDVRNLGVRSKKSIEIESKKCDLLCFNCHMELHSNEVLPTGLEPITRELCLPL